MKRTVVRAARLGFGSLLVLAGVISGFIPILQGWILILAGLSIMAPESEKARRALDWAKKKVQKARKGGADAPAESHAERSRDI